MKISESAKNQKIKKMLTTVSYDERCEAAGLKKNMEKFSVIFQVVLQMKVVESVNVVSKLHQ